MAKKKDREHPPFEHGRLENVGSAGWVVGRFAERPRDTKLVEVKWARHQKGPVGKGWVKRKRATTLSVLVSGRFRMHFQDAPESAVDLTEPGDYVLFGPGIPHYCEALADSVFLTVRWPSRKRDDAVEVPGKLPVASEPENRGLLRKATKHPSARKRAKPGRGRR